MREHREKIPKKVRAVKCFEGSGVNIRAVVHKTPFRSEEVRSLEASSINLTKKKKKSAFYHPFFTFGHDKVKEKLS